MPTLAPTDLRSCADDRDLAALLGRDHRRNLMFLAYVLNQGAKYTSFSIPKRSGGTRQISAPRVSLLLLQRQLVEQVSRDFAPRAYAHGFIAGRSIATNADPHINRRWVFNIDLENFFSTIHFGRVYGRLQARPYSYAPSVARVIAHVACFNKALATGSALSPLLSNLVCDRLDSELSRLAHLVGCRYSRYADDITFSTDRRRFPDELAVLTDPADPATVAIGVQLQDVLRANGFVANSSKTRLLGQSTRQEVTGLVVNSKRNVPRSFVRQVRCMLHAWEKFGLAQAANEHFSKWRPNRGRRPAFEARDFQWVVRGKIEFIRSIRGSADGIYFNLATRFNNLTTTKKLKIIPFATADIIREAVWVIEGVFEREERQKVIRGGILARLGQAVFPRWDIVRTAIQTRIVEDPYIATGFFAKGVGIVTCDHCVSPNASIKHPSSSFLPQKLRVVRRDRENDLCVVETDEPLLPGARPKAELELATAAEIAALKVGDELQIAGFPSHLPENQVSIKTARITRFLTQGFGGRALKATERQFVLDGGVIEGNSGGPVLYRGKVVGVAVKGAGPQNAVGASIAVSVTALPTR